MKNGLKTLILSLALSQFCVTTASSEEELKVPVDSYEIVGNNPLSAEETTEILKSHTGKQRTLAQIQEAAIALEDRYKKLGYGFYQVSLAPQTLDNAVIKLSVNPLKLNNIYLELSEKQNQFFSKQNILSALPALKKGESPNLHQIIQQVELSNLNPAKKVNVLFSINEDTFEDINADIDVTVQNPVKYTAWLDNTGSKDTGDYRVGVGYKHHNFFDKDHEFSFTYTTSPDHLKEVKQFGLSYRLPLYAYRSILQFYAHYSDVDSGTVAGGFDVSGQGQFVGAKYEWYLPKLLNHKTYSHQLIVGLDDKLFKNDVFFGTQSLGSNLRATPVSLAYKGKLKGLSHSLDFYAQYDRNLAIGAYNTNAFYALNRANSNTQWDVLKVGLVSNWMVKNYRLLTQVDVQLTDKALISGEQFGLGGVGGKLRGFDGREVNGDTGIKASVELWAPPLWNNQLNVLGFLDTGYAHLNNALPGETEHDTLMSVGIGVLMNWKKHVDLSVYVAHVLDGVESTAAPTSTKNGENSVHFSLYLNY